MFSRLFRRPKHGHPILTVLAALLAVSLLAANAHAGTMIYALGGDAISADTTAAAGGNGAWTPLTGPSYAEASVSDLAKGTVILTVPAGFEFNTASPVTIKLVAGDTTANKNINHTSIGGIVDTATVTATTITWSVINDSSGNVTNYLSWQGIQVRPLAGTPLASGNIIPSGTSNVATYASSAGTLTEVAGAGVQLSFVQQPSNTASGAVIAPAITVKSEDQFGNAIPNNGTVTLSIGNNPAAGTLSGTTSVTAIAGIATFNDLSIDAIGTGYTLETRSTSLASATSAPFNITALPPTISSITPSTKQVGDADFVMTVYGSNFETGAKVYLNGVDLGSTIYDTPAQLRATVPAAKMTSAGPYSISVYNPTANTTSNTQPFTVNNPIPVITSIISPTNVRAGDPAFNLLIDGSNFVGSSVVYFNGAPRTTTYVNPNQVSAAILASDVATAGSYNLTVVNPTPGGGTSGVQVLTVAPAGSLVVTPATSGTNISADKTFGAPGAAYTTLGNIVIAEGSTGDIGPANASNATIILSAPSGWQFNPGVGTLSFTASRDISTASLTVGASAITITFSQNSPLNKLDTFTLSGIQVQATNGTAPPLAGHIYRATGNPGTATVTGVTTTANSDGTSGTNFGSLSQTVGAAAKLVFVQQPTTTSAGVPISPAVTVKVLDQFNNQVPGSNAVTLAIGTNPAAGTLSNGGATNAIAGLATFSSLSINNSGVGYTLTATSPGLTSTTSSAFDISAAIPLITSIYPISKYVGDAGFTMTVNGNNFEPTAVVRFNGDTATENRTTTFVSANQLTVTIPASDLATAGTFNIKVYNPGGNKLSNAQSLTVNNYTPTTTSISSTSKNVGDPAFTMTVYGSNFVPASKVRINGVDLTTSYVTPGQLTADLTASNLSSAGTFNITVNNPTPGGGNSNAQTFTVNNPLPITTSIIAPTSVVAGGANFTLVIDGSNFVSSSVINFNGSARATTYVSPTQVQAVILASDIATAGTYNITVVNPSPGGGTSNIQSLIVLPVGSLIVTPATSGTNLSADNAANASSPAYTSLGNIVITEGSTGNIGPVGTATLILTAPVGWSFNPGVGAVSYVASRDISAASINVQASTITLTLTVANPINKLDTITVSGIQVRANDGASLPAAGHIYRATGNPGTITVTGVTTTANTDGTAGTNFGSLSQVVGAAKKLGFVQQPTNTAQGASITPAVTVKIMDQFNTTVPLTSSIAIAKNPASPAGTLTGTSPVNAIAGLATFSNLSINSIGTNFTLDASSAGLTSATSNAFNITTPTVTTTSIYPLNKLVGDASFTLTVNGTNFEAGSIVRLGGSNRTTTYLSATQLTATIPASDMLVGGTPQITVYNPSTATTSNAQTLTINNPVPATTYLSVTNKNVGDPAFVLSVYGSNFVASSVVKVNGVSRSATTSYISPGQLNINIPASDMAAAGYLSIAVFNNTPGGGTSNAQTLTVNNLLPTTISIISPANVMENGPNFTIQVSGNNFVSNSVVYFNGAPRTTTFINANTVSATILAGDIVNPGTFNVTVFNPTPGGGMSNAQPFVVLPIGSLYVTAASSGTNLSADIAANSTTPAYTTLSNIVITEGANNDIGPANATSSIILSAPAGWQFNPGVGTVSYTAGRDITAASVAITASAITVSITQGNTNTKDAITISGIQVQATSGASIPAAGHIYRASGNPGTATINGVTNTANTDGTAGTDFGALSQVVGAAKKLGFMQQPTTTGSNLTITPAVTVAVQDQFSNLISSNSSSSVTLAIANNPAAGTLSGTLTATAVSGLASFNTLKIDNIGVGYTLSASSAGLTGITSSAFDIITPVVSTSSINPTNKNVGDASFTLIVYGSSFESGAIVRFAGSDRVTSFVSSTQLTVVIPASDMLTAGTYNITVFNPISNTTSNAQVFTVRNKTPTTTSITPTSKNIGDVGFPMTVNGSNFTATSVVYLGANALTTTFVSPTQLTADVPASLLTTGGTFNVTVVNPTPGGGTSNAQVFTVNSTTPTTTSISPVNAVVGGAAFTMTVYGSNFANNATVYFNGLARTTTYVSSTQLTAAILASDIATVGSYNVTVFNPAPGGGTSNAQVFTVLASGSLTVTPATGGSTISADLALNSTTTPGYTSLGNIVISEGANGNIGPANATNSVILTAPSGWKFLPGAGSVAFTAGNDITAATLTVTASTITINVTMDNSLNRLDVITISGIQVQADNGAIVPGLGYIYMDTANTGTATVTGVVTTSNTSGIGATSFGTLSQVVGAAAKLGFVQQPSNTEANSSITPAVTVAVQDQFGNTRTSNTSLVTLAIGSNPGSGTLSGTLAVSAIAGLATFSNLAINNAGVGYSLSATAIGLTTATSTPFDIVFPAISSINPTSAYAGDPGFTLTVNGSNFVSGAIVRYNGSNRTTTFVSSSQLTASIPASDITTAGTYSITVFHPLSNNVSSGLIFTVNNRTPTITSINPASKNVGDPTFTMTVNGTNYIPTSVVYIGATPLTTTYVSSTQLTVSIAASYMTTAGTFSISVTNPAPGGGNSNTQTFTVNNLMPTTTSISPVSADAGDAAFSLTVNGTNFVTSSVVNFNGQAKTTHYVSATQVTADISASDIATAGVYDVTVTNPAPGGGTSTPALQFTVNAPGGLTVTPASNGSNISADLAFDSTTTPSYTTLGDIVISEGGNSNIGAANGSRTLILTAPSGWAFNAGVGTIAYTAGMDIIAATLNVTTSTITITLTLDSWLNARDTITLSGIQVQATSGVNVPSLGYIHIDTANPGSASTAGLITTTNTDGAGATSFGSLSQAVGAAKKLSFTQQPTDTNANATITPAVTVEIQDQFSHRLSTNTSQVSLAISNNPAGGTLSGTLAVNAVSGIATFSDLSINNAGVGYTLSASSLGLTSATSSAFTINNIAPTLTSLSPSDKYVGDPAFTMTVNGTNFIPTSVVYIGATLLTTTYVSATQLTVTIDASYMTAAGTFNITVVNPGAGGTSNVLIFTVSNGLVITPASGGTNIPAIYAANASGTSSFTTLGNIVITESANTNIGAAGGARTLVLNAPSGWKFNPGVGNISVAAGRDISSATIAVTATTITLELTLDGLLDAMDVVTVSGIQVQADLKNSLPSAGDIYLSAANPGTATTPGVRTTSNASGVGGTSFGALSQAAGPVSASRSTVTVSDAFVQADGSTASIITITLKDAVDNLIAGKAVTLSAGSGSSIISAASGLSDANGIVTFTVKDFTAETVVYTATADSVVITQTATVTFTETAANSTISASPASVPADGTTASTITVTLKDGAGHGVSGKTVSLNFTPASATLAMVGTGVSDANGVATFTVTNTAEGSFTFTATTSNITVGAVSVAFTTPTFGFNAVESGTDAVSGKIYTKIAGQSFTLDIVALTASNVLATRFTNTVAVDVVDSSAGSCDSMSTILSLGNQTFSSADQGRHSLAVGAIAEAYPNASIRIKYPATTPTVSVCSRDMFAIRPDLLKLEVTDGTRSTAGTTNILNNTGVDNGTVHNAGQRFTIKAIAQNTAGTTTTNYTNKPTLADGATMAISITPDQCSAVTGVCTATRGIFSMNAVPAESGVMTDTTATYSEVGAFALPQGLLQDQTFADVDKDDGGSASNCSGRYICSAALDNIGRFVPDHFTLTAGAISAACSAAGLSYMGQSFNMDFTLEARNSNNVITSNYTGSLAKTSINVAAENANAGVDLSSRLAATLPALPASLWSNGTFTLATTPITFSRGTSEDGPYDDLVIGLSVSELDAVPLQGLDMHPTTAADCVANNSCTHSSISTSKMRYGRVKMNNAYGSELLDLPMFLRVEYWNGNAWAVNTDDSCTALPTFPSVVAVGLFNASDTIAKVDNTRITASDLTLEALKLTAPGEARTGSVNVTIDVDAWLRYDWGITLNDAPPYNQQTGCSALNPNQPRNDCPTARATFGILGEQSPVIYMGEDY